MRGALRGHTRARDNLSPARRGAPRIEHRTAESVMRVSHPPRARPLARSLAHQRCREKPRPRFPLSPVRSTSSSSRKSPVARNSPGTPRLQRRRRCERAVARPRHGPDRIGRFFAFVNNGPAGSPARKRAPAAAAVVAAATAVIALVGTRVASRAPDCRSGTDRRPRGMTRARERESEREIQGNTFSSRAPGEVRACTHLRAENA